jgi:hypothetical protein
MPVKTLPANANLAHLKYQARDLQRAHQARDPEALQRIREFHPRFRRAGDAEIGNARFTLTDAQFVTAREHGFASWPRLKNHIETEPPIDHDRPHHERITEPLFRRAVDLLDDGDERGLAQHLNAHPDLVRQRVIFEGGNYFRNPTLLEFVAENPIRRNRLPPNIVEVARLILEAGAKENVVATGYTLSLVCSGRVTRECGVQIPLIDLLCQYGPDPTESLPPALVHGEFEAVDALLRHGAKMDLAIAAGLGRLDDVRQTLAEADAEKRHLALAWSAQFGHVEIVRLLLDAGEDPGRYNPPGSHAHSTPLHQAVIYGHEDVVRLLVERGARLDLKDTIYHATPLGWAEHAGQTKIADFLRR